MIWTNEKSEQKDGRVDFVAPQFTLDDGDKTLNEITAEINAKYPGVDVKAAMRGGLLLRIPASLRGGAGKKVEAALDALVSATLAKGDVEGAQEIIRAKTKSIAEAAAKYLK